MKRKYNGWTERKVIDLFLRYAKTCFEHYGEYAKIGSMITKLMTYLYTCAPEDVAATQLLLVLELH